MKKNSHTMHIWFWQRMITPHMTELVTEIARQGCNVTYVAEEQMAADRAEQGWTVPRLPGVRLEFATTVTAIKALVASAPGDSIHICQGIRANGLVRHVQSILRTRGLRQWVIMETVDDAGWRGLIKRIEYRRLFAFWQKSLQGVLAIGEATPKWVTDRGMPDNRVFPFAYFLRDPEQNKHIVDKTDKPFRFVFVGQFIERKRLDLLLDALQRIDRFNFELTVIGTGPLEAELKLMAEKILPNRLHWIGLLPQELVSKEMAKADCLVLPSRYDGWGAVVSEALMIGTPVICSNKCGSAGVARASGKSGVFKSGDLQELISTLEHVLSCGRIKRNGRSDLANWAKCLGAEQGAFYLMNILQYDNKLGERPVPPWKVAS